MFRKLPFQQSCISMDEEDPPPVASLIAYENWHKSWSHSAVKLPPNKSLGVDANIHAPWHKLPQDSKRETSLLSYQVEKTKPQVSQECTERKTYRIDDQTSQEAAVREEEEGDAYDNDREGTKLIGPCTKGQWDMYTFFGINTAIRITQFWSGELIKKLLTLLCNHLRDISGKLLCYPPHLLLNYVYLSEC